MVSCVIQQYNNTSSDSSVLAFPCIEHQIITLKLNSLYESRESWVLLYICTCMHIMWYLPSSFTALSPYITLSRQQLLCVYNILLYNYYNIMHHILCNTCTGTMCLTLTTSMKTLRVLISPLTNNRERSHQVLCIYHYWGDHQEQCPSFDILVYLYYYHLSSVC